ncbi:MAG: hypothetical protein ACI857_000443 [Arenicella sp.]|jgi:hypothetical protein
MKLKHKNRNAARMNNLRVLFLVLISLTSSLVNAQDTIIGLTSPDHFNIDGTDAHYYNNSVIRLKKDSSLFNGVWTHLSDFKNDYSITIVYRRYAHGKMINSRSQFYCVPENLSLKQRKLLTNPDINELFFCGESSTNNDSKTTSFINQKGDTYETRYYYHEVGYSYSSNQTKKTYMSRFKSSETFSKSWDQDSSLDRRYEYNEPGDTILWRYSKRIDTNIYLSRLKLKLGDTASFETKVNGQLVGYKVDGHYELDGYRQAIRTMWNNGKIQDILNEDVIYVDSNMKVISKAKYLGLVDSTMYNGYWAYQLTEESRNYHFVLYPIQWSFEYKKLKKIIRKHRRKHQNSCV